MNCIDSGLAVLGIKLTLKYSHLEKWEIYSEILVPRILVNVGFGVIMIRDSFGMLNRLGVI